jgi:tRNA pseudouridine13 synthase
MYGSDLPYAFGGPLCSGVIRSTPGDFRVDEISVVTPDGTGEHALLQIEKRGTNTDWVAGLLARHAGVPRRDVSYAGMKDRNAVTRQWFSVRLAGRPEPAWQVIDSDTLRVLVVTRHGRKLRTGALKGNRFELRIRDLAGDPGALDETLSQLSEQGMPNYYGEQRFGHNGENLERAQMLFAGSLKRLRRHQRGIYLSAARAMLFNQVLAQRVKDGSWNRLLPGERVIFAGSRSGFSQRLFDQETLRRFQEMDLHPSGPLWGKGDLGSGGEAAALESSVLEPLQEWRQGLEAFGLKLERRALRTQVAELAWSREGETLHLGFMLPKGCFATTLLRELIDYR